MKKKRFNLGKIFKVKELRIEKTLQLCSCKPLKKEEEEKPACKLSSEGTRENFFYWRALRILWISLTHDQSCKIMCNHWRAGHRIGIETWTMWHSNTHRWNWGLIHGDVIQVRCCNYFFIILLMTRQQNPIEERKT